jgi:hypothetical protein
MSALTVLMAFISPVWATLNFDTEARKETTFCFRFPLFCGNIGSANAA